MAAQQLALEEQPKRTGNRSRISLAHGLPLWIAIHLASSRAPVLWRYIRDNPVPWC